MIARVGPISAGTRLAVVPTVSANGIADQRVEPIAAAYGVRLDRRADFLAHLIATRDGFAQARARRRATPSEAIRAYGAAARLTSLVEPAEWARA